MKHLSGLGDNWHLYTRPAMLTYNTYNTPNLDNLSPFELAFRRKPILVPKLECTPHVPIAKVLLLLRLAIWWSCFFFFVIKLLSVLNFWGML